MTFCTLQDIHFYGAGREYKYSKDDYHTSIRHTTIVRKSPDLIDWWLRRWRQLRLPARRRGWGDDDLHFGIVRAFRLNVSRLLRRSCSAAYMLAHCFRMVIILRGGDDHDDDDSNKPLMRPKTDLYALTTTTTTTPMCVYSLVAHVSIDVITVGRAQRDDYKLTVINSPEKIPWEIYFKNRLTFLPCELDPKTPPTEYYGNKKTRSNHNNMSTYWKLEPAFAVSVSSSSSPHMAHPLPAFILYFYFICRFRHCEPFVPLIIFVYI